jgi:flavin-dependent dehydrogenase
MVTETANSAGALPERRDVIVIGAGPSGSIAAALLKRKGWDVLVLEAQKFPRFSIGESLLTHCLDFVDEAGMLEAVEQAGFQFKNGAAFIRGDAYGDFNFAEKSTPGRDTTFQVLRASFDKLLADEAAKQGVEIRYETRTTAADVSGEEPRLRARDAEGREHEYVAKFVLDASGFGRVLPRLLDLETPSDFPVRSAFMTHVEDRAPVGSFDRDKIQIVVHPVHHDVWYWLIPLSATRCSVGCVARSEFFDAYSTDYEARLRALIAEEPFLSRLLVNAHWDTQVRELAGYAANVKSMHGNGFALLGNAAEFLDPIFSSGVTIAMRSSSMAAGLLDRQLRGERVDWTEEFERPLRRGVDTFRAYVEAWYDGRFQRVMFAKNQAPGIRRMICSILAGYAWDETNPFVAEPERRLNMVAELCR